MAAAAIALQLKRNTTTTTNVNLIRNPNSIKFFSSSSSSSFPQPPPPNDNDETTPFPSSQSQSQPSLTSYFKDLKSSLKQPSQQPQFPFQQTQQPFQQTQQTPFQRPQQTQSHFQRPQAPFQRPQTPPTKAASFDEIRKNLAEFRNRTAPPPPSGLQNSQSPFPSPARASNISFQELYNKNVASRGNVSNNADAESTGKGVGKMSYDMIRESLKELKKNRTVEVNKGNDTGNRSKLTDSLFGPAKSTPFYGGTGVLPAKVFGKEGNKKKEGESGEMKNKFLRMYTYADLGERLKMLRPEEAKEKKGKWFSLKELSERLIKLRDVEEKESKADPRFFSDIRESLHKLTIDENKKPAVHRIDILGQLGGSPNYMMSPPKENLVEKYFHPDNMSSAEKMKIELKRVRDEFKMSESDCGSSRVQVAQLTTKIKHLSSTLHKKDKHSRKGLQAMVQQRKKLLKYLRRTDWDSYCFVLDKLGLRDNPDYKN